MSALVEKPSALGRKPSAGCQQPTADGSLASLLQQATERHASDLLLVVGAPPTIFASGCWEVLPGEPLNAERIVTMLDAHLSEEQQDRLTKLRDLDVGFEITGLGRYRMNVHFQRGSIAAALRVVPQTPPPFDQLGLPPQVLGFADFPNGLLLVTGATGQGKSTTLASLVDHLNGSRRAHIVTVEDPIEFSFPHGTCLIEQRQIGDDTPSFASALKHILRQRPDVILLGEMRDLETIAASLTAAETGHLVLSSLHTSSAAQTLARIIDVFPASQQPHVRTQVAASLRAIVCQALVRDLANGGLVLATEVLLATSAIRRAIRDNETHLVYSMIETGRRHGMHTLEQSLAGLVNEGRVAAEDGLAAASDPARLERLLGRSPAAIDPVTARGDEAIESAAAAPKPRANVPWATPADA